MTSVTLWPFIRLCKQAVIALIIVVVVAACGGDAPETATPPGLDTTPAAGGMVMPTTAATGEAPSAAAAPTAVPTVVEALFIGDAVQTLPAQQVRLYSDATATALVMSVYAPGARFTVLDPSGDYAIYPVERDGRIWYRLRAPDGLIGWGAVDQLESAQ